MQKVSQALGVLNFKALRDFSRKKACEKFAKNVSVPETGPLISPKISPIYAQIGKYLFMIDSMRMD